MLCERAEATAALCNQNSPNITHGKMLKGPRGCTTGLQACTPALQSTPETFPAALRVPLHSNNTHLSTLRGPQTSHMIPLAPFGCPSFSSLTTQLFLRARGSSQSRSRVQDELWSKRPTPGCCTRKTAWLHYSIRLCRSAKEAPVLLSAPRISKGRNVASIKFLLARQSA